MRIFLSVTGSSYYHTDEKSSDKFESSLKIISIILFRCQDCQGYFLLNFEFYNMAENPNINNNKTILRSEISTKNNKNIIDKVFCM